MNQQTINRALKSLAKVDPDIAKALPEFGSPQPRIRENSFEALLSIIVSQQISTHAAKAIMARVAALLAEMSSQALLTVDDQALRDAGLSWRKVEYAKGLATAVADGLLNFDAFKNQSDEEVIAAITALRGFGRWSAEIYLMFSLKRRDVFPADDLALLVALGRLKGMDDKPTPKQARELVQHWAPYRSVGALFLWHYYHGAPA